MTTAKDRAPNTEERVSLETLATTRNRRKAALAFATLDFPVLPLHSTDKEGNCTCGKQDCSSPGKHPRTPHGLKEASSDPDIVRKWWDQWPKANIGIATGKASNLVVIDFDKRGMAKAFKDEHGIGSCPEVITPRGRHLYFPYPEGKDVRSNAGSLGDRIDMRAEGGYVVVPPSRIGDREYTWKTPPSGNGSRQELPVSLLNKLTRGGKGHFPQRDTTVRAVINDGERHFLLLREAGLMRSRGYERDEILGALRVMNQNRGNPPVEDNKLEYMVEDVVNRYSAGTPIYQQSSVEWPEPLGEVAFHGLAGDIVRALEPQTEADPAALLVHFLVAFGNIVGRSPHFIVEDTRHGANLFAVMVGDTSQGRKGTASNRILRLFDFDHVHRPKEILKDLRDNLRLWRKGSIVYGGLSSGEGLIWRVRDPIIKRKQNKKSKEIEEITEDAGADDKRLLVIEPEFATTLKVMARKENSLSGRIRNAWDHGNLETLTTGRQHSPVKATDVHFSLIGHVTGDEYRRYLTVTEKASGFANRFLHVVTQRSKELPHGGHVDEKVLHDLRQGVAEAAAKASKIERVTMSKQARDLWEPAYHELTSGKGKTGLTGAIVARGAPQCLRLSLVYALLDGSRKIKPVHLEAALEIWRYCEASARWVFGSRLGNPVADESLRVLKSAKSAGEDGMSRNDLYEHFNRNRSREEIASALELLRDHGLVESERVETGKRGRPRELWRAV